MLSAPKQGPLSPQRALWLALAAWTAYVLARQSILALAPAWDGPSYLRQDLVLTSFRAATAVFCWWLGRQAFGPQRFWGFPGRPGLAWALALGLCGAYTLSWFGRAMTPWQGNWPFRASELVINLIVSANEELAWRGTIWLGLEAWLGGTWALWGSSLLFTALHLGYQPWQALPRILATGLALGLARRRGASLGQLIGIHFAIDASLAIYLPWGPVLDGGAMDLLSTVLCWLLVAILIWAIKDQKENTTIN